MKNKNDTQKRAIKTLEIAYLLCETSWENIETESILKKETIERIKTKVICDKSSLFCMPMPWELNLNVNISIKEGTKDLKNIIPNLDLLNR